ncbi:unnamed protein product [Aureobasidium vineae]|uniref:Uncharacterized protein n=1 Tax=Aureobasidium vineae TaxID=2773715 RepID=A0A9N8PID7_9PEZI|nr:unnamed protein product [Aureobasidium vineae]
MTAAATELQSISPSGLFGKYSNTVTPKEADTNGFFLVVSPYTSLPHLLDLTRYSASSQLFTKALTVLQPVREDYATAEYTETFNLPEVLDTLRSLARAEGYTWKKTEFYVVSFRSQLSPTADPEQLFDLDAFSHQEAMASGGLLKYWYGVKDQNRRNLATCRWPRQTCRGLTDKVAGFWESKQHARDGGKGPWHAKARAAAVVWYESIVFKTYILTIGDGVDSWDIKEFGEKRE